MDKGVSKDGILEQDLLEIDGLGQRTKPTVGIIGGLLGQVMLCFNVIGKHFAELDRPKLFTDRTGEGEETQETEHLVLCPSAAQYFIYNYVLDRMAVEKIFLSVGVAFEKFLGSLERPMKLGEMRPGMKEGNYNKMREILSDTKLFGDPVMKILKENQDALGLENDVFDLIYEGFWDLYTLKPKTAELSNKKLVQWITKVIMSIPDD